MTGEKIGKGEKKYTRFSVKILGFVLCLHVQYSEDKRK